MGPLPAVLLLCLRFACQSQSTGFPNCPYREHTPAQLAKNSSFHNKGGQGALLRGSYLTALQRLLIEKSHLLLHQWPYKNLLPHPFFNCIIVQQQNDAQRCYCSVCALLASRRAPGSPIVLTKSIHPHNLQKTVVSTIKADKEPCCAVSGFKSVPFQAIIEWRKMRK